MPPAGARAAHRARLDLVIDLHARGRSITDIAAELGVTHNRAASLLGQAVDALPAMTADQLRATSEIRLDLAAREIGKILDDPDADARTRTQAVSLLVQAERSRSQLLGSWLKPERVPDD